MSDAPVIHKRVTSGRYGRSRCYTLCKPTEVFEGTEYNWQNPRFVEWEKTNKNAWKHVTCLDCLQRRKFQ